MENLFSKEQEDQIDAWINKDFNPRFEWIFEAFKNSCKRSRQNIKQLWKDLFRVLTGKRKKNKNK